MLELGKIFKWDHYSSLVDQKFINKKQFYNNVTKNQLNLNWQKSCNNEPARLALQELTKIALPANIRVGQNFQMGPTL